MKATVWVLVLVTVIPFILGLTLGAAMYRHWVRRKYPEILGATELERMIEEQD